MRTGPRGLRRALLSLLRLQAGAPKLPGTDALVRRVYPPAPPANEAIEDIVRYEGLRMKVDTRSFIEWAVYVYGGYELGSVRLVRSLLRPGDVCVDAGANIGTFTLPLAQAVGESGRVLAFEPHPRIRNRLLENLALNGVHNVEVSAVALSANPGSGTLFGSTTFNQGSSSLLPSPSATEPFPCDIETLYRWSARAGNPRIDLIKVDTEGSDLAVLQGAAQILMRDRPHVFVEANTIGLANFGTRPEELLQCILDLGYSVWRNSVGEFSTRARLVPLRSVSDLPRPEELGRGLGWENWLAMHPERTGGRNARGGVA